MRDLVKTYFNGDGVPADRQEGLRWLERILESKFEGLEDHSWDCELIEAIKHHLSEKEFREINQRMKRKFPPNADMIV